MLSPGFSIGYINGLEPLMLECIGVLQDVLDSECENGNGSAVVDMARLLSNLTSVRLTLWTYTISTDTMPLSRT